MQTPKQPQIDFQADRYLSKWLGRKKERTRKLYMIAIKHYLGYTKMTPEELIMEKWEDHQKKPLM